MADTPRKAESRLRPQPILVLNAVCFKCKAENHVYEVKDQAGLYHLCKACGYIETKRL